jgi:hypothetical protein
MEAYTVESKSLVSRCGKEILEEFTKKDLPAKFVVAFGEHPEVQVFSLKRGSVIETSECLFKSKLDAYYAYLGLFRSVGMRIPPVEGDDDKDDKDDKDKKKSKDKKTKKEKKDKVEKEKEKEESDDDNDDDAKSKSSKGSKGSKGKKKKSDK